MPYAFRASIVSLFFLLTIVWAARVNHASRSEEPVLPDWAARASGAGSGGGGGSVDSLDGCMDTVVHLKLAQIPAMERRLAANLERARDLLANGECVGTDWVNPGDQPEDAGSWSTPSGQGSWSDATGGGGQGSVGEWSPSAGPGANNRAGGSSGGGGGSSGGGGFFNCGGSATGGGSMSSVDVVGVDTATVADLSGSVEKDLSVVADVASFSDASAHETVGGDTSAGPDSHSGTNTVVPRVDEADFVKTDGAWLYIVSKGQLFIVDSWPPEEAHLESISTVEGRPKSLYVYGDRAVLYSSLEPLGYETNMTDAGGECVYGYNCDFLGDGHRLRITVLDVSDRSDPRVLRETSLDGSYVGSRRIDEIVHTVVVFGALEGAVEGVRFEPVGMDGQWWCSGAWTEAALVDAFSRLRDENEEHILLSSWSPDTLQVEDVAYTGEGPLTLSHPFDGCQDFHLASDGDGTSLLSVVSFDLSRNERLSASTIVGDAGAVMASAETLYVGARRETTTRIFRFELSGEGAKTTYSGTAEVDGRVLNPFCMNEHDGHLRVATTLGTPPNSRNDLYVLDVSGDGDELPVVGSVVGFAPNEDIRSCRFVGDDAYVVTFLPYTEFVEPEPESPPPSWPTDPLFVLDLADPTDPRVLGELIIPGYATYMHLLDADHVLTIGYGEDGGLMDFFEDIVLRIIDVSDPAQPTVQHEAAFPTFGPSDDAATDYRSFQYDAGRGLLAMPLVTCSGWESGDATVAFSGLRLFQIAPGEGIFDLGGIPHTLPDATGCLDAWTSDALPKRGVYMDDWLYSIALNAVVVSSLGELDTPVASVPLD